MILHRLFLPLAVFPVLFGLAVQATTPPPASTSAPDSKYQPLIEWVEIHTGARLVPAPIVLVVPTSTFKNLVNHETEYGGEIIGAEAQKTILLDERVSDMESPSSRAVVIHELTHYKQEITGQKFTCVDQAEAEAFRNQNEYLVEIHLFPIIPEAMLNRMAACAESPSPLFARK